MTARLPQTENPRYQIKIKVLGEGQYVSTIDLPNYFNEADARAVFPQFLRCAAVTAKRKVRVALYHWPSDTTILADTKGSN